MTNRKTTARLTKHRVSNFKKSIRQMIREEMEFMRIHKLIGPVDYITSSGSKYFADVFLNGFSPKFQETFATLTNWTQVAGAFTVSGGIATSSAAAQDLAVVTGSNYGDLTYLCQVYIPSIASNQEVEIVVRYQDVNNYYALVFADNTVLLRKLASGAATTLASVSVAFASGSWYWFRLQAQGQRLTGWTSTTGAVGSWQNQIQATDGAFTTGAVGIRDISVAAQYKTPTVYSGVTPAIPVRPGVGSTLSVGQEVFVEKVNFNGQDLLVDMARVI